MTIEWHVKLNDAYPPYPKTYTIDDANVVDLENYKGDALPHLSRGLHRAVYPLSNQAN